MSHAPTGQVAHKTSRRLRASVTDNSPATGGVLVCADACLEAPASNFPSPLRGPLHPGSDFWEVLETLRDAKA